MSTSAYYNFITAPDKVGGATATGTHSIEAHRQTAVSPSSFATSSSNSSSSLNQFNSLTQNSVASSTASSSSSSASSTSSSSSSSSTNSNHPMIVGANFYNNRNHHHHRDLLRQSSTTPTQSHHASQLFHSYTLHSLEPKPLKPFKTSSDYLEAMKEDLAEWLNRLYTDLDLTPDNFFAQLETGSIICRHANNVTQTGRNFMTEQAASLNLESVDSFSNESTNSNCNNNNISYSPSPNDSSSSILYFGKSHRSPSITSSLSLSKSYERNINWFRVKTIPYKQDACAGTFFARDNICQFILWCRSLNILECLLFETDDLVGRKNEKSFILCLLEVARIGFKVGMPTPLIIQLEQEIDREIENDAKLQKQLEEKQRNQDTDTIGRYDDDQDCVGEKESNEANNQVNKRLVEEEERRKREDVMKRQQEILLDEPKIEDEKVEEEEVDFGPKPQVITNDLVSLHEKVVQLLCLCTCPTQFPMVRVGDNGKYKVGDKLIIFVRILRRHIMVRVGGGWQELSEFLRVKDPCRSRLYQPHNHQHHHNIQAKPTPSPTVLKSRLGESTYQLNKGHQHYRNGNGGQRLISGSASVSWLSHNS